MSFVKSLPILRNLFDRRQCSECEWQTVNNQTS